MILHVEPTEDSVAHYFSLVYGQLVFLEASGSKSHSREGQGWRVCHLMLDEYGSPMLQQDPNMISHKSMEEWKNGRTVYRMAQRLLSEPLIVWHLFKASIYSSSTTVQYKQPTFMATQCNKVGTERSISVA